MPKSPSTSRISNAGVPSDPKNDHSSRTQSSKTGRQAARRPRSRFEPEYELLLRRLVEARKAANVTQTMVAKRLGKTQSHVSMCENREREISIIDLWKWCDAIGIALSDFIEQFEAEVNQTHQT